MLKFIVLNENETIDDYVKIHDSDDKKELAEALVLELDEEGKPRDVLYGTVNSIFAWKSVYDTAMCMGVELQTINELHDFLD